MMLPDPWLPSLLAASLKGSLILAAALVAARLMRRASAQARHGVLITGIAAFLVLPLAALIVPAWRVPIPDLPLPAAVHFLTVESLASASVASDRGAVTGRTAVGGSSGSPERSRAQVAGAGSAAVAPDAGVNGSPSQDFARLLLLVWLAGAALVAIRLAVGVVRLRLLSRRSTMVTDGTWLHAAHATALRLGLSRGVTLLRGDEAAAPMTWGVLRPVVWLPPSANAWPRELRAAVLSHELAHVKRRDAAIQWIANVAVALHWFNPLVWMAARALRVERERACDDTVLAMGTAAEEYAGQLLEMVRELGTMGGGPAPALAMARRSQLEGRLLAILDRAVERGPVPSTRALAVVTFAAVFVAVLGGARVGRGAIAGADEPAWIAAATTAAHVEARTVVVAPSPSPAPGARAVARPRAASSPATAPSPAAAPRAPAAGPQVITEGPAYQRLWQAIVGPEQLVSAPVRPVAPKAGGHLPMLALLQQQIRADTALLLEIIAATNGLSSSDDRLTVLDRIARMPALDSSVVAALGDAAGRMASSSRAKLLRTLISQQPQARGAARSSVLRAVAGVSSSAEQGALLELFLAPTDLDEAALVDGLTAAAKITSSDAKSSVLVKTARSRKLDGPARDAFIRTARTLTSSTAQVRVLTALLGEGGPSR